MRAVPRLGELYPGIRLTTEEKARKTLSQGGLELSNCLELAVRDTECPLSHFTPVQTVSSPC